MVRLDVRKQVFDEVLASEALAEEVDVRPDNRPEIENHRRFAPGEGGDETAERLGRQWRDAAPASASPD